jgi:hypothetical protein
MRLPAATPLTAIASAFALAAAPLAAQDAPASAESRTTMVVEWTRLKALPGERANLAAFIHLNWFAMDAKAVEVGYPTPAGYNDPATQAAFGAIRAAHKTVPVEGKTLRELGTVLGTERLPVLTGTR